VEFFLHICIIKAGENKALQPSRNKGGRREAAESDDGGDGGFHLQENPLKGHPSQR
jgi:hypothetical protein